MLRVYFVTEGPTDQAVLEGIISKWLGDADFEPIRIQPPGSDYVDEIGSNNLQSGWKGVLGWCEGRSAGLRVSRDEVVKQADCLIVHVDADVAVDSEFSHPPFAGACPPARDACDWVRARLAVQFGDPPPTNLVFCVPSKDIEAWVVSCLHPEVADRFAPIECRESPASLLAGRPNPRLVRAKGGGFQKSRTEYARRSGEIAAGWTSCAHGQPPRCLEAKRFEIDMRAVLGV